MWSKDLYASSCKNLYYSVYQKEFENEKQKRYAINFLTWRSFINCFHVVKRFICLFMEKYVLIVYQKGIWKQKILSTFWHQYVITFIFCIKDVWSFPKKKEKNYYEKCWEIKCQKMNTEEVDCFLSQQLLYFWS